MKAEMGVMQLQGRDHPGQPANIQEHGGACSRLPLEPLKGQPCRPLISGFQSAELAQSASVLSPRL